LLSHFSTETRDSRFWEWWILRLWSSVIWRVLSTRKRVRMIQKNLQSPCTLNLLKKVACSSKMVVPIYQTTSCHIQEDHKCNTEACLYHKLITTSHLC
jgi:hypothetical protein